MAHITHAAVSTDSRQVSMIDDSVGGRRRQKRGAGV
jgi:hypothetical protein